MLTTDNVASYLSALTPTRDGMVIHPQLAALVLRIASMRTCRESGRIFIPASEWDEVVTDARATVAGLTPVLWPLPDDGTATYPREQIKRANDLIVIDDPTPNPPRTEQEEKEHRESFVKAVADLPRRCDVCGNKLHSRTRPDTTTCKPCASRIIAVQTLPASLVERTTLGTSLKSCGTGGVTIPPSTHANQTSPTPITPKKAVSAPVALASDATSPQFLHPESPLAMEIEAGKRQFGGKPFDIHQWKEPKSGEMIYVAVSAGQQPEPGYQPIQRHSRRPHGWVYQMLNESGRVEA